MVEVTRSRLGELEVIDTLKEGKFITHEVGNVILVHGENKVGIDGYPMGAKVLAIYNMDRFVSARVVKDG